MNVIFNNGTKKIVKQLELEKKVTDLQLSVDKFQNDFLSFKGETAVNFLRLEQRIQEVADKTKNLDRLYTSVDKLMGEIDENRKERAILLSWYHDHEDRILSLEQLQKRIPAYLL